MMTFYLGLVVAAGFVGSFYFYEKSKKKEINQNTEKEPTSEKEMFVKINEHWLNEVDEKIQLFSNKIKKEEQSQNTQSNIQTLVKARRSLLLDKDHITAALNAYKTYQSQIENQSKAREVEELFSTYRTLLIELYDDLKRFTQAKEKTIVDFQLLSKTRNELSKLNENLFNLSLEIENETRESAYEYGKSKVNND